MRQLSHATAVLALLLATGSVAQAQGDWEMTSDSQAALERGLEWLARNQGPEGNWGSNDLGLVSMGALAFMSAGHMPGVGPYGESVDRALDYMITNAKPSGLLNIAHPRRDMYNHGLSTFVLGQAYGMTNDPRMTATLDRALQLIVATQCEDGGWNYTAARQTRGNDLSLAVMQAKALRSAMDSGLEVPPEVISLAIQSVREHYHPSGVERDAPEADQRQAAGQFTYRKGDGRGTPAMAAAGVVCLQEFGQYDDWRIEKNMEILRELVLQLPETVPRDGRPPFDPYTLYYVGQAIYQVGGEDWEECYPRLRDYLVQSQLNTPSDASSDGMWIAQGHVRGEPGNMYSTAVACFILAMPNRYLPILQEGEIESIRSQFGENDE